jgi:hypothetical protein
MPRLRRSARERKQQPKLDERIYRWLEAGRPDKGMLAISTRWAIFLLEEKPVHKWECSHDPNYQPNRTGLFWNAVMEKVRKGELEIGDMEHRAGDPSLVTELEALKFEAMT